MNVVDIAILAVLLLSALAAFSRGFVREVLAVGSWVAAIFAVIYLLAPARPFLRQYITYPLLADGITGAAIFVITLAVCTTLASYLSRNIRGGALGAVDRSLGLLFGLARGVILVCLAYMLMVWVMPQEKDRPAWLQQAHSLPMVANAAEYLRSLVPADMLQRGTATAESLGQGVKDAVGAGQVLQEGGGAGPPPPPNPTNNAAPDNPSGYKDSERKDLNRLIQGTKSP
jgi:membrane protein required for colicin V production